MDLPFTTEQFLAVFERYNLAIWPLQAVAYALGLVAVALVFRPVGASDRIIGAIMACFWLWMGAVYHLAYFSVINGAAIVFGVLFIVQGVLWLLVGVARPRLAFRAGFNASSMVGGVLILYAMVAYPIIGTLLGHGYPRSPSFGVAPCPTTIFTFGLLLWTRARPPTYVLAIPLIWSAIGFSAAFTLGIYEDIGLPIAGVLGTALLVWRDGRGIGGAALRRRHA
jgi:Family of unknown function (DUF6064)